MANSTTNLDLIQQSQSQKEVTANALYDAASPAMTYGRRASTTAGLTWGYYGGAFLVAGSATPVSNGTIALTASATNYIEADPSNGAVSKNTAGFTSGYLKLYTVVTNASGVTSYTDHRASIGTASGGGGGGSGDVTGPASATDGEIAVFNGASGKAIKVGGLLGAAAFKAVGTGSTDVAAGNHTHDDFTGDSGAGGTYGMVPAPGAGDAAAAKYLSAAGNWDVPQGTGTAPIDGKLYGMKNGQWVEITGGGGGGSMSITTSKATFVAETTNAATATTEGTMDVKAKYGGIITMRITNGATGPTAPCQGVVYVSHEDTLPAAGAASWRAIWMFSGVTTASASVTQAFTFGPEVRHVKTTFTGNTGQDVTVEALASLYEVN